MSQMNDSKISVFWLLFLAMAFLPAALLSAWFGWLHSNPQVIDTAFYDVDGDGSKELVFLHYGPTFGVYTIELTAVQSSGKIYDDVFHPERWGGIAGLVRHDGLLCICVQNGGETHYCAIGVSDGHFTAEGFAAKMPEPDWSEMAGNAVESAE